MTTLDEFTLALDPTAQVALGAILAFIMFGVGLGLAPRDFQRVLRRPGVVLYGAALQLLALPALTWLAARSLSPAPSMALGMIVVAACPGGSLSNLMTLTARGDTALSVTLTALSSLSAVLLTPVGILFWASLLPETSALLGAIALDRGAFLLQTALVLALPLALGMFLAARAPTLAARLHKPCHRVSLLALGVFIVGAVGAHRDHIGLLVTDVMPIVVGHNALALSLGYLGARVARLPPATRRTFTFEIGIQNAGLGLVLVIGHFPGLGGTALITAGWGIWHLISGTALSLLWARRPPSPASPPSPPHNPQPQENS